MRYPTVYHVLTAEYSLGDEIDGSEGALTPGAPKDCPGSLLKLLTESDLHWMHNRNDVYFLIDPEDEPLLSFNQETGEIQKFHAYREEIKQQTFGKEVKRLLDRVLKVLKREEADGTDRKGSRKK